MYVKSINYTCLFVHLMISVRLFKQCKEIMKNKHTSNSNSINIFSTSIEVPLCNLIIHNEMLLTMEFYFRYCLSYYHVSNKIKILFAVI